MTELLYQKSLQDLVKGIRANKKDPSAFISLTIAEIKQELKSPDPRVKAQAVNII
jgi:AP-3 complex subunit delta-1